MQGFLGLLGGATGAHKAGGTQALNCYLWSSGCRVHTNISEHLGGKALFYQHSLKAPARLILL